MCPDGPLWVDVGAFEEAAITARHGREAAAYRAALDLYSGDLLPQDRYETWVKQRRTELRELYLSLLVELAALCEERAEYASDIEALNEVVAKEPKHEDAHAGLMRLYALSGRRREALGQYERLRGALFEEPDPASTRLQQEIWTGTFPPDCLSSSPSEDSPYATDSARNNLPIVRTSFVGRERETVEVRRLLAMTGLLTLTGTGGSGKTRLALEVAGGLASACPQGVWLVELAPLSDASLVPQAVARALDVPEIPGRSTEDTLTAHLQTRNLLLVLDNCEHLVDAVARLTETLLGSCPRLRVLATSREPLGVRGEALWTVPPLSLPDSEGTSPVRELAVAEAVRLFVDRARLRLPGFELTGENAEVIGRICRKLEGMPLAIELAAARTGALSVEGISERLEDFLQLLTGGGRTVEPRQRTLRATLDWSHDLLSEPEQALFRRLSVFAGGWTLEGAEEVCPGEGIDREAVFDLLVGLVDKSLVVAEPPSKTAADLRYRMLEPVGQYARERLEKCGAAEEVWQRHTLHCLAVAEAAESKLTTAEQVAWLEKLEVEHGNIRAALGWSLEHEEAEIALRLSGALWRFWYVRGHVGEGRYWLDRALSLGGQASVARAKALGGAGRLTWIHGDFDRATTFCEESIALSRRLGDKRGIAFSLDGLALVRTRTGDYEAVRTLTAEALAMHRELGDRWGEAQSLYVSGLANFYHGDHAMARRLLEESLTLFRETGDREGMADSLGTLGVVALSRGDYEAALSLMEEVLEIHAPIDSPRNRRGISISSCIQGNLALEEGEHGAAQALYVEALTLLRDLNDKWWISRCLDGMAGMAVAREQPVRAARLFGSAAALREAMNAPRPPGLRPGYERNLDATRAQLDRATFATAWEEGRTMGYERAIEYALSEEGAIRSSSSESAQTSVVTQPQTLTPREREVALLVERGLTNRGISSELSISERTVENHVRSILKKLGYSSRARIAAWVAHQR